MGLPRKWLRGRESQGPDPTMGVEGQGRAHSPSGSATHLLGEKRRVPGTLPPAPPPVGWGQGPPRPVLGALPGTLQPLQRPPPPLQEALCGLRPACSPARPTLSITQHLWLSGEWAGGQRAGPGCARGRLFPHRLLLLLQGRSPGDTARPRGAASLGKAVEDAQPRCLPAWGLWLALPPGPSCR